MVIMELFKALEIQGMKKGPNMTEGAVMVIIVMMIHLMQKLDLETSGEMIKEGYLLGTFELCSGHGTRGNGMGRASERFRTA